MDCNACSLCAGSFARAAGGGGRWCPKRVSRWPVRCRCNCICSWRGPGNQATWAGAGPAGQAGGRGWSAVRPGLSGQCWAAAAGDLPGQCREAVSRWCWERCCWAARVVLRRPLPGHLGGPGRLLPGYRAWAGEPPPGSRCPGGHGPRGFRQNACSQGRSRHDCRPSSRASWHRRTSSEQHLNSTGQPVDQVPGPGAATGPPGGCSEVLRQQKLLIRREVRATQTATHGEIRERLLISGLTSL
jgi:hypothetical protein